MIPPEVQAPFDRIAPAPRKTLLDIREMVFDVAQQDPCIGPLDEGLRWGEPAYLTTKTKTGSTVRLGIEKTTQTPAVFFNCQTTLVEGFRAQFGNTLRYSKNRAVLIRDLEGDERPALRLCLHAALTYHLRAVKRGTA